VVDTTTFANAFNLRPKHKGLLTSTPLCSFTYYPMDGELLLLSLVARRRGTRSDDSVSQFVDEYEHSGIVIHENCTELHRVVVVE